MNITHATLADAVDIAALEAECFPAAEAASPKSISDRVAAFPECFWLLRDPDGTLISFINGMATDLDTLTDEMYEDATLHDPNGAWQMIFGVDTRPEWSGQGNASRVMLRVIEDCRTRGRKGIVLTCKEHLIGFYARFGFVCEGVSASEHGGALWYAMRLTL